MSLIKICGLKRAIDIEYANECMPDFVGFVFAESRRRISPDAAAEFRPMLNKKIQAVGIFVNEKIETIEHIVNTKIVQIVQLHGDEDAEYVKELKSKIEVPIIKSVAIKDGFHLPNFTVDCFLFDTYRVEGGAVIPGGSGMTFDWELLEAYNKPYFLAGGIDIRNVERALMLLNPYGIDVSSGVETNGVKDFNKMYELVKMVRGYKHGK